MAAAMISAVYIITGIGGAWATHTLMRNTNPFIHLVYDSIERERRWAMRLFLARAVCLVEIVYGIVYVLIS